ncbi:hypothetical protein [Portibacter marinus]|uniref:hypothetical protein n=1 Tax=Portibacter marinus TaxID=2898660 RepID=UPI001F454D10|nr:hypothetical protein [Portibacter marinus]
MFKYLYVLILFSLVISCINAPDYPVEPEIEYIGISKNTLEQNSLNTDSLFLTFSFTDGDGDLGHQPDDTSRNIFIRDLRTGNFQDKFKSPYIPEEGIGNGITGDIELLLFTTCCLFPDPSIPPCSAPDQYPLDTVIYEIFIKDRAGNESNRIQTEPIIIRCVD